MRKHLVITFCTILALVVITNLIPKPTAESVCIEAFTEKFGGEFESPRVKEKSWNPSAFDLSGYYSGGEWNCSGTRNPLEFQSGQLLPIKSNMIWFTSEDLSKK
jgi:hypothetical protein